MSSLPTLNINQLKVTLSSHKAIFFGSLLLFLGACQSYEEKLLEPEKICQAVVKNRIESYSQLNLQDSKINYDQLLKWMENYHPEILKLKADYQVAIAVREFKTPFPNPSIEFGPTFFMNSVDAPWKVAPFVSLGVTIPLSKRMNCEDYLNDLLVQQSIQAYQLGIRELQINLRESYIKSLIAQTRLEALIHKKELMQRLCVLGITQSMNDEDLLKCQNDYEESFSQLAQSIGCPLRVIENLHLMPVRRVEFFEFQSGTDSHTYLHAHAELLQLEHQFHIEDAKYRLELARQLPDLNIGPAYAADEAAVQTIGLAVGWEIPVFDRNQRAIAESKAQRDAALVHYQVALHTFMTEYEDMEIDLSSAAEKYHAMLELNRSICTDCGYLLCQCDTSLYHTHSTEKIQKEVVRMNHYLDYLQHETDYWNALLAIEKRTGRLLYPISTLELDRFAKAKKADVQNRTSPFYRFFNLY